MTVKQLREQLEQLDETLEVELEVNLVAKVRVNNSRLAQGELDPKQVSSFDVEIEEKLQVAEVKRRMLPRRKAVLLAWDDSIRLPVARVLR